jgi:membrane dipeptidase
MHRRDALKLGLTAAGAALAGPAAFRAENVRASVSNGASAALGGAAAAPGVAPAVLRRRYRIFDHTDREYSERAIRLIRESTVLDLLGLFSIGPDGQKWLNDPDTFTEEDLALFHKSGINAFHIAVGLGGVGSDAYTNVLRFVAAWNGFIAAHDEHLMRVDSVSDLARLNDSGKIGVIIGLQNSDHFLRLDDIDTFFALGQRISQLTYNARNRIGNGSTERTDGGLSDFGMAVVDRMNRAGMAVDVSHCGDQTTLDAFEASAQPVLITHSNCRALVPGHPRCKTDEAIRAVGRAGSVMGITGVRMFVKADEPTTIEHMLDHYDHVAKLIGPEHVGVGSDMDLFGYDALPAEMLERLRASYKDSYGFRDRIDIEGVDHPQRMYDLTEGLIRRRYTDAQISGILGGNFQRVLGQIWSARVKTPA